MKYKFIEKLKKLSFIDEIWLFGSRARGDYNDRSDIDIALVCGKASRSDWLSVVDIIDNADTLLKIDCLRLDSSLDKRLYQNIIKDKKLIYKKKWTLNILFKFWEMQLKD